MNQTTAGIESRTNLLLAVVDPCEEVLPGCKTSASPRHGVLAELENGPQHQYALISPMQTESPRLPNSCGDLSIAVDLEECVCSLTGTIKDRLTGEAAG
jgi:hypothetical protein